jgi:hypothetical protein
MISSLFMWQNLAHVGAILYLICFTFRNQLLLRSFAILGEVCLMAYYITATSEPLWTLMFYSAMNMLINLVMIGLILRDQRHSTMSDNDMKLYQGFGTMTPGDFRRLTRIGSWNKASEATVLTKEGEPVKALHYILDGGVAVIKAGREIPVDPRMFVGEIAYLKNTPASATVTVAPGTTFITWPYEALNKLTEKNPDLKQSLMGLLGSDLALKVART